MKNELKHHGVKGQKWGVRNGPPYPIETGLKKGQRLDHVSPYSTIRRNSRDKLYLYNPEDSWDTAVYKGPYTKYLLMYKGAQNVYNHRYEVAKDLKMPTKKERVDTFLKLYEKNKVVFMDEINKVNQQFKDANSSRAFDNISINDLRKLKKEKPKEFEKVYTVANQLMDFRGSRVAYMYYKEMRKNFDAMVDDNNVNVYNKTHDPIIIFNPKKSLIEVGKPEPLTFEEFKNSYDKVEKEMAKDGRRPML